MAMLNNQMVIIKQTMIKALLTKNNIKGFIIQKILSTLGLKALLSKNIGFHSFTINMFR